ncbi:MAG: glucosaminidase domain-containing protein [Salinivirgaceae bacterium]|nr:glucosaminidase domain-containing protein [Salinivirgaceae bacterium]MDY0279248.1 glucosaminidase domain-containing protein [Salinivirgaceae bacterium]
MEYRLIFVLFIIFGFSTLQGQKILREEYILMYKDIAIEEMERTGVLASITLAQGIVESNGGNSELAKASNNHFGIKCHSGWSGEKVFHDDNHTGECFRAYRSPEESFRDHSDFLALRERYSFLFELDKTDYKGWCKGLRSAGYATDRSYDQKLIRIIESYQLYQYDRVANPGRLAVASKASDKKKKEMRKTSNESVIYSPEATVIDLHGLKGGQINNVDYIVVQSGDTWGSLIETHNKMPWELYRYNDISREMSAEIVPGQIIYLQPKRRKAEKNFKHHIVAEGETLWSISQKYGVRLKRLYKLNRMTSDQELLVGQRVYLRHKKPE